MQQKLISPWYFVVFLLGWIVIQGFSPAYGQPQNTIPIDPQNVDKVQNVDGLQIEVLDRYPAAAANPVTLGDNSPLYLRLSYRSATPVRIYAEAFQAGSRVNARTSGSPILPAGENETLVWVALTDAGTIDEIILSYMVAGSGNEQILHASMPINAAWADVGINSLSAPVAWVNDLLALSEQRRSANVSNPPESSLLWNLFIAILVLLVSGSIVSLCIAAMRQWQNYWRALAGAPLAILVIWVAIIVLSMMVQPESHNLWPFEIFAWAMGTSVYMMLLMTAKKTFIKADQEKAEAGKS